MIIVKLRLEQISGDWFGWMDEYPGAYTHGNTPEMAALNAAQALMDYFQWLCKHDELLPKDLLTLNISDVHVEVIETIPARHTSVPEDLPASFASAALPLEEADIAHYLLMLGYACADLRDAANNVPPKMWDEAPTGIRSVRAALDHLCDSCVTLLTLTLMVGSGGNQRYDGSVAKRIRETEDRIISSRGLSLLAVESNDPQVSLARWEALHEVLLQALRAVPTDKHNTFVTLHKEHWTLHKLLRQALWHERYHAAQIAAIPEEYFSLYYPDATDYLDSLDMTFYTPNYYPVWTRTILALTDLIGPDTDAKWQRLKSILLGYYDNEDVSEEEVRDLRQEIGHVRGAKWWHDDSVLGLKYRVLNAIHTTKDYDNIEQWMYGIWTAVELINFDERRDQMIIRRIQDALTSATISDA